MYRKAKAMTLRKRVLWIVIGAVAVVVLGVAGYLVSGSSAIESWVGSQLLEIGGTYLQPELKFERLTFVRPRTILLDRVTLSSPDPANPGHSVVILAVKRARLELAEVPRRGQPIKFSQIILESPEIHMIAATPGSARLLGFSNLLKGSADSPASASASPTAVSASPTPASAGPASASAKPPPMKLSDFLLIRRVELTAAAISYDPRIPGTPPIWLDGINARLDFNPADTTTQPGLYAIATTISRKPAFDLDLQGKMDIDTLAMALAKFDLSLNLQEENLHVLPPALQNLLKSHEVTGQLHVAATGTLPLANWRQAAIQAKGELTAARVAAGRGRVSIDTWNWDAEMTGGMATIRKSDAQLLGGELHLAGTIPMDASLPANLKLNARNLRIQKLLRASNPGEAPDFAGNVAADITFSAPLAKWNTEAGGSGTLSIRQGRIDKLPVLGTVFTSLNNALSKTLGGSALTDSADGNFTFAGNCVRIDLFTATSGELALRGGGTIGFDRRLDLRLNGGPMERLQNSLGAVGRVWASASDAIAGYQVSGTVADPQVSMVLGGGP
jgi:hypothetical protein